MLVREDLGVRVHPWGPTTCKQAGTSPYHFWLKIEAASGLPRPMLLAAVYLPPFNSKYGLRSRQQLEEFFTRLGDEVAEGMALPGGVDMCLAGDWNAHLGSSQESGEYSSSALQFALGETAEEVLVPCAGASAGLLPLPPRASLCCAPPCEQGRALLQFCSDTGMRIMNGRLPGDQLGLPTCFAGSPSVIDMFIGNPGLLLQATQLRVLEAVPEYTVHRPLELRLPLAPRAAGEAPSPQVSPSSPKQQPPAAAPQEEEPFGPPPSMPPTLRITEDRLPAFKKQLIQPAFQTSLAEVSALVDDNPVAAADQLHDALHQAAAAVFPQASSTALSRRQRPRSGLCQLPYFDRECQLARIAARQRIRELMLAEPTCHLAREAVRVISSKYNRLRNSKHAAWRGQRSTALLHVHRTDPRAFYRRWKQKAASNPLPEHIWLPHCVHLQRKRKFKPTEPPPQQPSDKQQTATATAPPPNSPHGPHSTQPATPPPQEDPSLDQDWTADDVLQACKKLSSSSTCLGPLKAVLVKTGREVLAPMLAKLFTAVFRSGSVPREWLLGAISAIHKKGDTTDPNNYRGITVGHVLGKLFALMLNQRLTTWTEANGKRAAGQAGFRPGFRTTDNCFILRAMAERARAKGNKLYICAVDLEKAFDCVDRPQLWAALRQAGIGGRMLGALQALYADVPVCVKTAKGLSGTFQSIIGVKQGCPLSPLLFGIFLDDFEPHLQRTVPPAFAQLPLLCGRPVPPLLFADDMLLLSTSVAGLNAQLRALQTYCDAKKLTVNAAKTQVMIMRPGGGGGKPAAAEKFFYAGKPLDVVPSIKYLGLTFSQLSKAHGFACCAEELAKAGRRAMFAMRRRAWELGAGATEHQLQLFDIFVKPVLSYGCEVWGVDILCQLGSAPERVHRWLCRRLLGLSQGASSAVALAELGRWPLHVHWTQQLVRFWNRMLELQESDRLTSWAFQDNLDLMRDQLAQKARTGRDASSPCWCLRWLRSLAAIAPTDSGTLLGVTELDEEAVLERARTQHVRSATATGLGSEAQIPSAVAASPSASRGGIHTTGPAVSLDASCGMAGCGMGCSLGPGRREESSPCPGPGSPAASARSGCGPLPIRALGKFAWYLECVRGDTPLGQLAPHLADGAVRDARHRACLSRFRCSCHDLRIERDRYLPVAVKPPRHLRTCLLCASNHVEDEHHLVFICPLYDSLRLEFADLFSTDCHTVSCFLSQNQDRVAQFVYACSTLRCNATQ